MYPGMLQLARRPLAYCLLLLGVALTGAMVYWADVDGDTRALLNGSDGLLGCLRGHQYLGCTAAERFPLFQMLLAVPFRRLGVPVRTVGLGLAWVSIAAFGGILRILWRDVRERSELVAGFAVLLMATGLPLAYARHSLGEIPSAFFVALFVSTWLRGRSVAVAVAALLATLTKETIPPFLVLLGLVCATATVDPDATLQAIVRPSYGRLRGSRWALR
jgi:hypothetical protein